MHVLFLLSSNPCFGHSEALNTVQALLMESLAKKGVKVSWAIDEYLRPLDTYTAERLAKSGIKLFADFANCGKETAAEGIKRRVQIVLSSLISSQKHDLPRFTDPENIAKILAGSGADVALLFWDTNFEFLAPFLNIPVAAYAAKPRYDSSLVRLENTDQSSLFAKYANAIHVSRLKKQKARHLKRFRSFDLIFNIDKSDCDRYAKNNIPCEYIPNTWGDPFGKNWKMKRSRAESFSEKLNIFGSFSTLTSLGNQIGIRYWAEEIVPILPHYFSKPWCVNVYGKGYEGLPEDLQLKLNSPHVNIRGFVDDIDRELLSNQIFLLCNNVGPYTGGYTRVVYAMAGGSCIIAHTNLKKSMPEVIHGNNIYLCDRPEDFAKAIALLANDKKLRNRIAMGARKTYEMFYHPDVVGASLLNQLKSLFEK